MDQVLDDFLENSTSKAHEHETMYKIHFCSQAVVCFVSLVADLLIVTIVLNSKRMRTRTNNVIMHFAIADSFCMLNEMGMIYYALDKLIPNLEDSRLYCVLSIYEMTSQIACFVFVLFLISNTLIQTQKFSDKILLIGYYATISAFFLAHAVSCAFYYTSFPMFHMLLFILFMITIICIFIKEINRCCKTRRNSPLSQKTAFRMNIARIYVYSWLFNTLCYGFQNDVFLFLGLIGYMSGLFILMYLIYSHRNFRISLLNLLRCRNYDIDVTISFADSCSESINDNPVIAANLDNNLQELEDTTDVNLARV